MEILVLSRNKGSTNTVIKGKMPPKDMGNADTKQDDADGIDDPISNRVIIVWWEGKDTLHCPHDMANKDKQYARA